MNAKQQGFTLVELVVVIVILGILAATAIPKFVSLTTQARVASVNGMVGAINSAVALCQSSWFAAGASGTSCAVFGGTAATNASGILNSTTGGIDSALGNFTGFTYTSASGRFDLTGTTNCFVTYTQSANSGSTAVTSTGC